MNSAPLVSILCITYNQASFIKTCIDGLLMQICDFEIELIIANDASIDSTDEIVKSIIENNPRGSWIKYIRHEKNIGMMPNFISALQQCKGKYIALCEGDDYWTDPLKLQKQVDFLEENDEFGICFHESEVLWEGENHQPYVKLNSDFKWNRMTPNNTIYTIIDVFNGPFMTTASVVFRRRDLIDFPNWFCKAASGDITLYSLIIKNNKIKFINEVMCVYRRHPGGVSRFHRDNFIILNRIEMLKNINTYYNSVYVKEIEQATSAYLRDLKYLNIKEMFYLFKLHLSSNIVKGHYIMFFTKKIIIKTTNYLSLGTRFFSFCRHKFFKF
jgi:glycosyltransferase involved in cell wall biosynthesis